MVTINHFNIFYSWQSDINKNFNNYFIKDCITNAIKELKKENDIILIPRLDRDTQATTGSPKIIDTILAKIDASHLFISDVTIINSNFFNRVLKKRLTPNPNILFELGYALNRLSWDRIICLNNNAISKIEDLPFDIKQNRILQYNFNGKNDNDVAKKKLTELLKTAIKVIIDKYDVILSKNNQRNIHQHDIDVFKRLNDIINDTEYKNLLQRIASVQRVLDTELDLLDNFYEYLIAERNQFLLPELKNESFELTQSFNKMRWTLSKTLHPKLEKWNDELEQKKQIILHLPQDEECFKTHEEYSNNINAEIEKISKSIFDCIDKYISFRACVKRNLFI